MIINSEKDGSRIRNIGKHRKAIKESRDTFQRRYNPIAYGIRKIVENIKLKEIIEKIPILK